MHVCTVVAGCIVNGRRQNKPSSHWGTSEPQSMDLARTSQLKPREQECRKEVVNIIEAKKKLIYEDGLKQPFKIHIARCLS
jgi:hypothetical protein